MKVVLLAGGFGTRISEESYLRPKPMIEIGGMPILWHIMKYYSHYGYNDFIICAGYKQNVIKEYFANYSLFNSDITFDVSNNTMRIHSNASEPWNVTVADTGLNTMTGGRVKRIEKYLEGEPFMLTYGDGLCDIDLKDLVTFHKKQNRLTTITAVMPGGRFGALDIGSDHSIKSFKEKGKEDGGWINGGFMVMEPESIDYIEGDSTVLEQQPFERMASENQLSAYMHHGFWQCMDTLRDRTLLEELISEGKAPWIRW